MKTKYLFLILLINFSFSLNSFGKEDILYISTDREYYIAGENIWMSLFSFTVDDNKNFILKNSNRIAYLEISNSNGTTITEKILITDSRGSAVINIPPNTPSGYYNIYAYTNNKIDIEKNSIYKKRVAIINTLINQTVPEGVVIEKKDSLIVDNNKTTSIYENDSNKSPIVKIDKKENIVILENRGDQEINISLSIYNSSQIESDLALSNSNNIYNYLFNLNLSLIYNRDEQKKTNKEGERIRGYITNDKGEIVAGHQLFFSVAKDKSNIYSTITDSLGLFEFNTYPIYGQRELYFQVISSDTTQSYNYTIVDPFIRITTDTLPTLNIKQSYEKELQKRSYEMQIYRRAMADTLFKTTKVKADPLLNYNLNKVYILDHYTRFPYIRDILIEYVKELQHRVINDKPTIRMIWQDRVGNTHVSYGNSLILLDGIPLFDHSQIIDYDPLKIETLSIYPGEYHIGPSKFEGVVSFNTYKNDFADLKIKKQARLIEYKGVLYPIENNYQYSESWINSLSSLIYWNPTVSLKPGEKKEFDLSKSNLKKRVEGMTYKIEGVSTKNITPIYIKGSL